MMMVLSHKITGNDKALWQMEIVMKRISFPLQKKKL